jgi:hypothetical protein
VRLTLGTLFGMVLLIAVTVCVGVLVASLGPGLQRVPALVGPRTATTEVGLKNDGSEAGGGYSFDYPSRWKMRTVGAVTKVSSPDRRVVVSVGPAPHGPLRRASRTFMSYVQEHYERVHLSRSVGGSIGGPRSLVTRGSLTNNRGTDIRLLAVAISESGQRYLIAGFSHTSVDRGRLRSQVNRIVGSLRLLRPS